MKIAGTPRVRGVLVFWGLPEVAASGKPRPVRELFVFPVPLESPISLVWAIGLDKLPDSYGARQSRQSEEENGSAFGERQCACALEHERQSTPRLAPCTRERRAPSRRTHRSRRGARPARDPLELREPRAHARPPPVASPPTAASPWLARPRTIPAGMTGTVTPFAGASPCGWWRRTTPRRPPARRRSRR